MGCFYTDRPVDYEMVTSFSREQMEVIAPLEHERWIREQISMGWIKGDLYKAKQQSTTSIGVFTPHGCG